MYTKPQELSISTAILSALDLMLGSRAAVSTLRVLAASGAQLPASVIAGQAGLSRVSVYTVLNRCAALGVIGIAGSGQSRVFRLDPDHPLNVPLLGLFAAESARAGKLLHPIREWATTTSPAPEAVWMYGGGRHAARTSASVNLAVVGADESVHEQAEQLRRRVLESAGAVVTDVSVVSMTIDEVMTLKRKASRLWRELLRDAVPVHGQHPEVLSSTPDTGSTDTLH